MHILGERAWWLAWLQGDVAPALAEVIEHSENELSLLIECALVDELDPTHGSDGTPPQLHGTPAISPLSLGRPPGRRALHQAEGVRSAAKARRA